jgi:hypothetical protein
VVDGLDQIDGVEVRTKAAAQQDAGGEAYFRLVALQEFRQGILIPEADALDQGG